uniref:Outer membrane protein assembly factor BamA n=1 Tax=Candidatus Aschnera chinzeii TaxID=1485666 RepID=A0AAT9G402_9ENTR|nr:MAG: outer membrane protein assembly factor BamA [Candidatus Aschnera chinzeii]
MINAKEYFLVNKVIFEGLKRVTENTALLHMNIKIGDRINRSDIATIIKDLFSTGNFENIDISYHKNTLFVNVKEKPIISSIIFLGNKVITDDILKKNLAEYNIKLHEIYDDIQLINIKKSIKDFYNSIGKYNSNVKIITTTTSNNEVDIKFIFYEGNYAKIRQINIIGNKVFSNKTLTKYFYLRDKIAWWDFIHDRKYQREKFIHDLKTLKDFYYNKGYVNFIINSAIVSISPDKNDIYISINITEGDQYKVSDIIINSNVAYLSNNFNNLINIKKNELYNLNDIIIMEDKIKKVLDHYGYVNPNINTYNEINETNKTVKLHVNIDAGKKLYVRRINFVGNKITKDSVLRRELQQMEGTWLENRLLLLSKTNLEKTGFFENIYFTVNKIPHVLDQVDVTYYIKERNTGSMNFGMGFGTESGVNYNIGLQQDNFIGTGHSLGINASHNENSTYFDLSFINSYFTTHGVKFSGRLFYNNFNAKDADLSGYNNKSYGADKIFTIPVQKNSVVRIGFGSTNNALSDMKPQIGIWRYLISMNQFINLDNQTSYTANDYTVNLGWSFNTLNYNLFPTSGKNFSINTKITTPNSDNRYYKLIFNASQYFPINNNKTWILLSKAQFGYGNGFGAKELPFYENFYAGGVGTIRGFHSNTIGPKAVYLEKDSNGNISPTVNNPSMDAVGGNAIAIAALELITPTPFLENSYSKSIRTSFFINAGTVWDSNWDHTPMTWRVGMPDYGNFSHIRISAGVAMQWISPLGPLVFSYAKPIKNYFGDRSEEFQFNIGKIW